MKPFRRILLILGLSLLFAAEASAQFKEDAFTQSYNDPADSLRFKKDSTDTLFSFKEYFGGITHKRDARIGTLLAGSSILIGGYQMYNRDYWKLPIIYGGLGAGIGMGINFKNRGMDQEAKWCFAAAGLLYWGTFMDGAINYKRNIPNQPGKATIYSLLLPGLGQIYNGEAWKIPIYWGGLMGSIHFWRTNHKNYTRYRNIYKAASDPDIAYDGPVKAETAQYYRNVFRRYRDYSILATFAFYLLQVIDANVFAYMQDFQVSDDISFRMQPDLFMPDAGFAYSGMSAGPALKFGLTF
ncbi:MAG: DUF5683 domain-containing protein [Bacteroidota bacterium]|nr:DUF5683 domain-containing protein [Bacteroidota bacterium]